MTVHLQRVNVPCGGANANWIGHLAYVNVCPQRPDNESPMNRKERRAAASQPPAGVRPAGQQTGLASAASPPARPSFALRMVSRILLSPMVLSRVRQRDLERVLAAIAVEAGRPEVADSLLRRQAMRDAGGR